MKIPFHPGVAGFIRRPESGFALVITLSLMILLTVIAVGLLTLSSISLRASAQGQAMAEARANARLALMLAIGDLQKSLGPDRAVTATSEVLTASPAKPHVNLYRDPDQNTTLAQKRALLAGHRSDPSLMKAPDGNLLTFLPSDLTAAEFGKAKDKTGKIIDLEQVELLDAAKGRIKQFRHDLTPYSLGLLTDVRRGGLKQDLSSMFEMGSATANTLPAEFNNKKLYLTAHGISGASDPNWSALAGYYNSFRNLITPETNPTFAVTSGVAVTNPVPATYNPAPVIAKVDTIFSLVSRPFDDFTWVPRDTYDYMVSLIFTPVVTLHNPYNVNLSFHPARCRRSPTSAVPTLSPPPTCRISCNLLATPCFIR